MLHLRFLCRLGVLIATAIISSLATGCDGGEPIDPATVTPEVRVQAMDAVAARLDALPENPTGDQVLTVAAQAIAARPEFIATGSSAELGMAWGRFPGGATYVVSVNGRPQYNPPPAFAQAKTAALEPSPGRTGVPAGPAVLYHLLRHGLYFDYANLAGQISPWLLAAGYSVTADPKAGGSVEDLRKVNGPAFFYMGTHGVFAPLPDDAKPIWCALTSTEPTAAVQAVYAEDLADQSLVLVDTLVDGDLARRFAFTGNFVRKYMRFAPDSFVYMDACSSDSPFTTDFKDACFEVGASLYAGWSRVVSDNACADATPLLMSRMLGTPAPDGKDAGPPRRPFDYADAFSDLHLRGWQTDRYSQDDPEVWAKLAITEGPSGGGWLRPSIECLRVDEYPAGASTGQSELIIYGNFGADPGSGPFESARSVTCAGEELSIVTWAPEEIHATLPVHGPGSAGDVIVTRRDIKSNAVPLTEWWVTLVYRTQVDAGSTSTAFTEFSIDAHLRYDIHGWRATATSELQYALSEADDPPTHFASDTIGSFKCGGDESYNDLETGDFTYKIISGGSGSLPYLASGLGNGCWGSARLRYEYVGTTPTEGGPKPVLFIAGAVYAEGFPRETHILWADGGTSNEEQRRVALNEFNNGTFVVSQGQEFRLVIGEDGVIEAGESGNLTWRRTLPRYQPTDATPR